MEQAEADSKRVRAMLEPPPDDLKTPKRLVREGQLNFTEKKKTQKGLYCFLFNTNLFVTQEVKAGAKYKLVLSIKLQDSLKVTHEEGEEGHPEFVVDTGKRRFTFTAENADMASSWITDISLALDGEYNPDRVVPTFIEVDGERIWDVRAGLNAEQIGLVEKLRSMVDDIEGVTEESKQWCDDACLCRFLRARNYDIAKSFEMLKNTIIWRQENRPDLIKYDEVNHAGSTGDLYISAGRDRQGRVIIYMRPGKSDDTPEIRAQYVRYMAWIMETGCRLCDTKHTALEKMTWIVDFQGCRIQGGIEENVRMSKDTINVMQNMYPERLGMGFILHPPMAFWVLWKLVSVVLDPVTKRKIQFIRKKKDFNLLTQYIPPDQLEEIYGGTISGFNADQWKQEYFSDQ